MGCAEVNGRLWYPQLDVYDCVRRLAALVSAFPTAPGMERLCIADFYLANPPLLHWTKMNMEARQAFVALNIARPQKSFLSYPAPSLLFGKMEPVQKEALRAMGGKGLISIQRIQNGTVEFTEFGRATFATVLSRTLGSSENELVRFLVEDFAARSEEGSQGLRTSTGLRRAV